MFSFITSFIKNSFFAILLNDYFKRNYPEKYNLFLVTASYKLIHFYTRVQLFYNKWSLYIKQVIDSNPPLKSFINKIYESEVLRNEILQFKHGEIHLKYYTNNTDDYFDHNDNDDCIYIYTDNTKKPVNYITFKCPPFSDEYQLSNIKFILIEIKLGGNSYKIDLKTDEFNYYIVNNILDKKFFKYYITNHNFKPDNQLNDFIKNSNNNDKLIVKIIDHNVSVNEFEISNDKYIIIEKDNYIYSG